MKLLPQHEFELAVDSSAEQVRQRLQEYIEPENTGRWFPAPEDLSFTGWIEGDSFQICRKNYFFSWNYKQFEPVLIGTIQTNTSGTRLTVRMKLPILTIYLTWFLICAAPLVAIFTEAFSWSLIGRVLFFIGFILGMDHVAFWLFARKSKELFAKVVKETAVNTPLEPSR